MIVFSQQEFGSLVSHNAGGCTGWWLLPLTVGDAVQIDWEVSTDPWIELFVYPPGTSDFNYPQTSVIEQQHVNSNNKAELTFVSSVSGDAPLRVSDPGCHDNDVPGAYSFTANVTHALSLGLPHLTSLARTGKLAVGVHNPAGGPIENPAVLVELQVKGRGPWVTIGVAAVSNSSATITYSIPKSLRHRHIALRALAHGTGYQPTSSTHLKVPTH